MNERPTLEHLKVAQDLIFAPDLKPKPGSLEWWIATNPREVTALKRRFNQRLAQAIYDHRGRAPKG
jgi:hypothetical protein